MKMQVSLDKAKKNLTIVIPVEKKESKSGKSFLIATTGGNIPTDLSVDGQPLIVSVNAYIKK